MSTYAVLKEPAEIPRVFATPLAMHKMRYYIDNCDTEIGWLGFVQKIDANYIIEDVFLLKQKVHSATTEIDPSALADLATELIAQGEQGIAQYNKIRMWGHSHVNMAPSPSGQDNSQMDEFATTDFYVRLIGNKKGEWNVSVWDYANNILWTDLSLEYYCNVEVDDALLEQEIKDNVEKMTVGRTYNTGRYFDGYYYEDEYDYPAFKNRDAEEYWWQKKIRNINVKEETEEIIKDERNEVIPYEILTMYFTDKNVQDILSYYDTCEELEFIVCSTDDDLYAFLEDEWNCMNISSWYLKILRTKAELILKERYDIKGDEKK